MTRVNINGHDHQVEIQHDDASLAEIVDAARTLWQQTRGPDEPDRPGAGASLHQQQAPRPTGFAWRMGDGQQPHVTAQAGNP